MRGGGEASCWLGYGYSAHLRFSRNQRSPDPADKCTLPSHTPPPPFPLYRGATAQPPHYHADYPLFLSLADLQDETYRALSSAQAATTEFLRQFWMSVTPDAAVLKELSETDAQRHARARRMLDLLRTTPARMDSLAQQAESARPGVGGDRVRVAVQHTMHAVHTALRIGAVAFPATLPSSSS